MFSFKKFTISQTTAEALSKQQAGAAMGLAVAGVTLVALKTLEVLTEVEMYGETPTDEIAEIEELS